MRKAAMLIASGVLSLALLGACGGDDTPDATPTPSKPGPLEAIAQWVQENRNIGFVGDCADADRGQDIGKLCVTLAGERGTRQAYDMGPTFSEATALVLVEEQPDAWVVLSVSNRDPSVEVPGIDWPLQVGDAVVIIGVGENDCLRIREQPTQQGAQLHCMPDGSRAIVQEGPVEAETFTWWRIAGDGFSGWAAGRWLRLQDAIADLFQPGGAATPDADGGATPSADDGGDGDAEG
jgi:hypothetical protein